MMSRLFAFGLVAAFAVLAGCSQDEPPPGEKAAVGESDLTTQRPRLLGLLDAGTMRSGYYLPQQPGAWAFHANPGDTITIDVTSDVGDAVAYLTDDRYRVLAYNDDYVPTSRDAQIVYTVPPTSQATSFRIVFVDYEARLASFDVALRIDPAATCSYGTNRYHVGDQFPAGDGCNTCTCTSEGIDCTKLVCACNPDDEPEKIYMFTPQQCLSVHVTCSAGLQPFQNPCGCGCKRP